MKIIRWVFYITILLLPILLVYLLTGAVKVNRIDCFSQFGPCSEEMVKNFENIKGKSVRDAKEGVKSSLDKNMLISDYSMYYKVPDRLEIKILIKKPVYGLRKNASGDVAEVTSEGVVLSHKDTSTNLPVLIVEDDIPIPGEKVDQRILFSLRLLGDVSSQHRIDKAKIENNSLMIDLTDSLKAIFPLEGDREVLTGSLNLIISKLNTEKEGFKIDNTQKILDLRLENPVLR